VPYSDVARPPYIAAINPKSDDAVYVRLNGFPGSLSATKDAGKSWAEVLAPAAPVQGFAVSPDGLTLLASTTTTGIYAASAEALAFERITCEGVACLSWSATGLLGCGDETTNGFTLGTSANQGATFEPLLHASCLVPASCPADSSAHKVCPTAWPAVAEKLGQNQNACDPGAPSHPFDVACLASDGGESSGGAPSVGPGGDPASEAGRATAGARSEPGEGGASGHAPLPGGTSSVDGASRANAGGCSCDFRAQRAPEAWSWLALGLVGLRRRRR
jgi:hypothetical protein